MRFVVRSTASGTPSGPEESPYTDFSALGVEGIFGSAEVAELMVVLDEIRRRAA